MFSDLSHSPNLKLIILLQIRKPLSCPAAFETYFVGLLSFVASNLILLFEFDAFGY